jgi:uncharacterized membrane protein YphA (DoxX/SURF4 family)
MNYSWLWKNVALKKPLFSLGRLLLGLIFILASIEKILNPADFAELVFNYQILPDTLINFTAVFLPWLEVLLGVLLIFGIWIPGALIIANLLLITFFSALIFNAARGLDIQCGCFSTSGGMPPHINRSIMRDAGFMVLALCLFYHVFLRGKP